MTEPRMLQAEGNPIWFDLMSADPAAAKQFYADLFGWQFASIDMGGGNVYHLVIDNDRNIAGIGNRPEGVDIGNRESSWLTHLYTADARATAQKVANAGGKILTDPHDVVVPGQDEIVGARATLANPAGGIFSLWQSGVGQGAEVFGEPSAFCWVEYHTTNVNAAKQWHNNVFAVEFDAMEVEESDGSGSATLHMMKCGTEETSCAFVEVDTQRMPDNAPFWMNYVMVEDIEASAARAEELGAQVPFGIGAIPFGSYATIIDPQGAYFGLWQSYD